MTRPPAPGSLVKQPVQKQASSRKLVRAALFNCSSAAAGFIPQIGPNLPVRPTNWRRAMIEESRSYRDRGHCVTDRGAGQRLERGNGERAQPCLAKGVTPPGGVRPPGTIGHYWLLM